jgi:MFS family permease
VFLVYLCFETMIVSTIPMVSELIPEARSTAISSAVTLQLIGRMGGALLGGALASVGFAWAMGVAAALNVIVLLMVWGLVREHAHLPTNV